MRAKNKAATASKQGQAAQQCVKKEHISPAFALYSNVPSLAEEYSCVYKL
ncbi:hypothetical protein SAMN04487894_107166 [Niabella drilacis]|uniref:Uncharacterized protein n=1 Tax=Niabella drilacis (strain DSM 25811 / CCM 8410 / CCUG 62505 / LMG 26954 / E90) TaxID=1285928 RepID=A0A1G6TC64_NIADE|nr:hypothetical protein SAMN04487894_107166 [Niabella drilacis]